MSDKYLELEIKVSYLEDFVSQINGVVIDQGSKIDRLIEVNRQLREKISVMEENMKETRDNNPPPHY